MQRYPMTPEGKVALEKELQQLKTVDRPRIIKRSRKLVSTVI
jgi:transcription elongation factor GreA